ncbi:fibrinogen-like YCDxxxxGGGW domain-containing protein [Vibrio owensii]|uniref:fibrinogen-like YCDxxxxGGGW domain-containing protein n=1 Tax=Vibrio owensii TaxID=696485 RepID=UPI003CC65EC6
MKTIINAAIVAGLLSANAHAADYLIRVTQKVDTYTYSDTQEHSDWQLSGEPYSCSEWTPKPIEIAKDQSFTQTLTCKQNYIRDEFVYKVNDQTGAKELLSKSTGSKTEDISSSKSNVGTYTARELCSDILARNGSSANGTYTVDYDGVGPASPRKAYCDMSGGGWTLFDDFGTKGGRYAYNKNKIYNSSTLSAAGYTFNTPHINSSHYYVNSNYMSAFYSSNPTGWIKKTMPSWAKGVKVYFGNFYTSNYAKVELGGKSKVLSPGNSSYVTFSSTGTLVMSEYPTSIIWIDSVWVK